MKLKMKKLKKIILEMKKKKLLLRKIKKKRLKKKDFLDIEI